MRGMRLLLFILVALVVLNTELGAEILNTRVAFRMSEFSFRQENNYTTISLQDGSSTTALGCPSLPTKLVYFIIPPNAEVTDVRAVSTNDIALEGRYDVLPTQLPKSIPEAPDWIGPDPEIYDSSDPYPGELVELAGVGHLAGHKIASVLVYPLQYSPTTGRLTLHSDIEITLQYEGHVNTSLPVERKSRQNQELFKNIVKGLVVNPQHVGAFGSHPHTVLTSVVDEFVITEMPSPEGSSAEYVIITSDALASEFQILADWKTKRGVPATVRTTSWIQANYPNGADLQETIRKFIQDAYTNWGTVWVLLGGDTDVVPVRSGYINILSYYGEYIPTDLYYACLDGNWNADGDGVFGEPGEDSVDLYPEVFIGRAPAQDAAEAGIFVDKLMKYSHLHAGLEVDSTAYHVKALFLGADMFESGDGAVYCDTIANYFPGWFTKTKLYESLGNENRQAVIDSLNEGFNLVFSQGHGSAYHLNVKRDLGGLDKQNLIRSDADSLKNAEELSIFYAVTCYAAAIDYDAFFEHFLNSQGGGGVAAISMTRAGFPRTDIKYNKAFFDSLFNSDHVKIGETHAVSRIPFIGDAQNSPLDRIFHYACVLLGEPEMAVWTALPKNMTVTFPDSVPLGPTEFTITVQEGPPMPDPPIYLEDALVCLKKGNEDYAYGLTNSSGQITFTFTPETAGSLSVVVTKQNYLPSEGYSQIYVPEPYVVYHNHIIDDDNMGQSFGNMDGVIDAGEIIEMPLVLKNTGSGTAYNVVAKLTAEEEPIACTVTITDSMEIFGDIAAGDTALSLEDFDFVVSTDCPDDLDITFIVTVTCTSASDQLSSTDEFTVKIRAPMVDHYAHSVVDTAGPGCPTCDNDGIPEGGESFEFPVTLRNLWGGSAREVTATLSTTNPSVLILQNSAHFGTIPGYGEATPIGQNFYIRILGLPQVPMNLTMTVLDFYHHVWVDTFDIYFVPASPTGLSSQPGRTTIDLFWDKSTESDLLGYNIYRDGSKVNSHIVKGVSYYQDAHLDRATDYTYAITAVDVDHNESRLPSLVSREPTDATNPLDHANWPVELTEEHIFCSPSITAVAPNQARLLIQGTTDGKMHILDGSGFPIPGWPVELGSDDAFWASPAVGDIDSDDTLEVIDGPWSTDNKVYAWNPSISPLPATGFRPDPQVCLYTLSGWPRPIDGDTTGQKPGEYGIFGSPALGDLDGDDDLEVVVATMKGKVYVWHGDGTGFLNPDGTFAERAGTSWNLSSPALGEVDTIPGLDIVVGCNNETYSLYAWHADSSSLQGFPVNLGTAVSSSPALGDIDPTSPGLEIALVGHDRKLYIVYSDGTLADDPWPQPLLTGDNANSPTLGDIDGDSALEIVVCTEDGIYAFEGDGSIVAGWPVYREKESASTPSLGDIDGDGSIEILVGSRDRKLYAYHHNGDKVKGFPIKTGYAVEASPALQDLDGDGDIEIAVASHDGSIYVWDPVAVVSYTPHNIEWGKFRHDIWNTGNYHTQVPDLGLDYLASSEQTQMRRVDVGPAVYGLRHNAPNPFARETAIQYQLPLKSRVELRIYNIAGQCVSTLVSQLQESGYYKMIWDGKDSKGNKVSSGVYFLRLDAGDFTATKKLALVR